MANHHFQKLERMYTKAPCNQGLSVDLTILEESIAEIRIPVQESFFHVANAMHGAYYFKLLDDAAFFAVNSIVTDVFVLTVSFNVQFIRPVSEGYLRATGTVVRASDNLFFANATIQSDKNKSIAYGSGVFTRSKIPLSKEIGYM